VAAQPVHDGGHHERDHHHDCNVRHHPSIAAWAEAATGDRAGRLPAAVALSSR
jgi:hypothetical protein